MLLIYAMVVQVLLFRIEMQIKQNKVRSRLYMKTQLQEYFATRIQLLKYISITSKLIRIHKEYLGAAYNFCCF